MTLESRLKAIIRSTERGKTYSDDALNTAVMVFSSDITTYISADVIDLMPDNALLSNYFIWEMLALNFTDALQRREQVLQGIKIHLLPSNETQVKMALKEKVEEPTHTGNVISLFGRTIH